MSGPQKPQLPIGYWLKRADQVLTDRINEAQRAHGLSRTQWQILNVLAELGSATEEQLASPLRPFADRTALRELIAGLQQRGLVSGKGALDDRYVLTMQGHQTHEAALALQQAVRRQAMQAISAADYATTVQVLQRIVENLSGEGAAQPDAAADPPPAGR